VAAKAEVKKRVVIIGAGLGGMSAAAYLAQAGFEVTIIEKNFHIGGRIQEWQERGFKFDLGPSWYWMPEVMDNLFGDFGDTTENYFKLVRLNPSYRVFFDNEIIDLPAGLRGMADLFEKQESGSGERLVKMLKKTQAVYEIVMRNFLDKSYRGWGDLLTWDQIEGGREILAQYNGLQSVESYLKSNFKEEKLRKILSFPIFFLGGSTKEIPAVYSLMNHVDINLGTWYPKGGFSRLTEGVKAIIDRLGVKVITGEEVEKINVDRGKAKAVQTKKGGRFEAEIVISNGDYYQTDQRLLDKEWQSYTYNYWQKRKLAPSALLIHLGLNTRLRNLRHHSLFFDQDWEGHNRALFSKPEWPQKPLFYVSCPSKTDESLAPENGEVVTILVPLASGLRDSQQQRQKYQKRILKNLENRIEEKIEGKIVVERTYGINDFSTDFNAFKGNAYGLGQTWDQTAIFRPSFRSKRVENLFYCGQFTTPGIGVPMVIISGQNVAREIIREFKP
jgi:phytoene desaturase